MSSNIDEKEAGPATSAVKNETASEAVKTEKKDSSDTAVAKKEQSPAVNADQASEKAGVKVTSNVDEEEKKGEEGVRIERSVSQATEKAVTKKETKSL